MITYDVRFDDGEHICSPSTLKEAHKYRSENNFKYLSRSIHIYACYYSRVRGCKLNNFPKKIKIC